MKTTIEIADDLLDRSKAEARKQHTTLRSLIEDGLRRVLDDHTAQQRPFKLRSVKFCGGGFQPGLEAKDWDQIREAAYEGCGA